MVTNQQVRRYLKLMKTEKNKVLAAAKSGMDIKTTRKYEKLGKLPSEVKKPHDWRTRQNPFKEDWDEIKGFLEHNPGLEAKTLFEYLQREKNGKYSDGQLRTLQRHLKQWRACYGPGKEVFFAQDYIPGERCQSDFTNMNPLDITIAHQKFDHLIYHFVLPYSNWETGSICFSESFESLSDGLQKALWELSAVPTTHQSDRLSAAVNNHLNKEEFTKSYQALLNHYSIRGQRIQAGKANENGDVEQSHYRFKKAVSQALMLRGSCNFNSQQAYAAFLKELFAGRNKGRSDRYIEELKAMHPLPATKYNSVQQINVKVGPGSTIRVKKNYYSVPARLIGSQVKVRLFTEHIEVWYAQKCVEQIPRLRGEEKHFINYRHIIDWLVRKPGAFSHYRYRKDLFPTHIFRLLYDTLKKTNPLRADKEYLAILHLAAKENETTVGHYLKELLENAEDITAEKITVRLKENIKPESAADVHITAVNLDDYDRLFSDACNLRFELEGAS